MIERARKINRALLELWIGILFVGLLCQLTGMWFVTDKWLYTVALWLGILLAVITVYHMYRTLDRTLGMGDDAIKAATISNLIRYVCIVVVFFLVWATGVLNPLFTFLGVMTLKVAAYIQPFTHKLCNKVFHEVDPIPESIPFDEESGEEEGENRI